MSLKKSKIKSIQEMWTVLQDLSTKPDLSEIEKATLAVCTQFFMCSQQFIEMFEDCNEVLQEAPSTSREIKNKEQPLNPTDETLAMVAGMQIAGVLPDISGADTFTTEQDLGISAELENKQLLEFHEMMAELESEKEDYENSTLE